MSIKKLFSKKGVKGLAIVLFFGTICFGSVRPAVTGTFCKSDFDCDGRCDHSDLQRFTLDFGRTDGKINPPCEGDLNNEGDVDGSDLSSLAADFGRTDCPPSLRISAPNAGEGVTAGTWYTITWCASSSIPAVDISLSLDSGVSYPISVAQWAPNDGTHTWGPVPFHDPARLSQTCSIRIADAEHPDSVFDESYVVFPLEPAQSPMTESLLFSMNEILEDDPSGVEQDGDGDGLYDKVEIYLGTDPSHWDTDRDGYGDGHETFHQVPTGTPIADQDADSLIKALDIDDNGDGDHDGWVLDFDGDGIADFLEIYGFVWNYPFLDPWDGDIGIPYFKTNPNRPSTDRDPYWDYDEATDGPGMDDFVKSPGDHPNIAALPNIVIMPNTDGGGNWWEVTLNQTLTTVEGTSVAKGTNWSEDTYNLTAQTDEYHWEVAEEVSVSLSDAGGSVSLSYGESHSEQKTTGTVRSEGGNILNSREWSTATCTTPLEAASIKFYLKAKNVGTCPVAEAVLTVNLLIGGKQVLTFELDSLPTLAAGGEFDFVLDLYNDFLPSKYLTLNELRLLDTGAPVTLQVYDILGGKVLGSFGPDWDYYQLNAEEVCARLFLDLGNGNTTEHLVWAGTGENANEPAVTLTDALVWAANAQEIGGIPHIQFYEPGGVLAEPASIDGWYFKLDDTTYKNVSGNIHDPDFNLFDTVLTRDSVVVAKAPPIAETPRIHWAELSAREGVIKAHADDYFLRQELFEIYFVDKSGTSHPMTWDASAGYYSGIVPMDYFRDGTEKIVAPHPMYPEGADTPCPWDGSIIPCPWKTEFPVSGMGYVPSYHHPYIMGTYDTLSSAMGVFVSGGYACVADHGAGLQVIDVSDPQNPAFAGACETPGTATGVFVSGNYAYVADGASGLQVIDISNPQSPMLAGTDHTSGSAKNVFVSGGFAYVADYTSGLKVINVGNPENPGKAGEYGLGSYTQDVSVSGNYAYVANWGLGLVVFNISNPSNPTYAGRCITPGLANNVFISGNYAYVSDWGSGFQVIDVSNPANPTLAGAYNTSLYGYGVSVSGDLAYMTVGPAGLLVIDIKDKRSPVLTGHCDAPSMARGVSGFGNHAYVADDMSGLQVIGFK